MFQERQQKSAKEAKREEDQSDEEPLSAHTDSATRV